MKNFHMDINITRNCNLRCLYCFEVKNDKMRNEKFEDFDNLFKFIDKFMDSQYFKQNYGTLSINFWGGEPLLEKERVQKITEYYLNDQRVSFFIYSNGYFIDDEFISFLKNVNIQRTLNGNPKMVIQVSYDGQPIHDKYRVNIRGKGSAKLVKENIMKLRRNNIPMTIKSTIAPEDFKYMYEAYLDVITIHNNYFPSIDLDLDFTKEQINKYYNDLKESLINIAKYEMKTGQQKFTWFRPNKALCSAGLDMLSIDTNGNIVPCHGALYRDSYYEEHVYTNIAKDTVVEDVINRSKQFKEYFGKQTGKCVSCSSMFCLRCNAKKYKYSKKENYFERWNDFDVQEYLCEYFYLLTKIKFAMDEVNRGM